MENITLLILLTLIIFIFIVLKKSYFNIKKNDDIDDSWMLDKINHYNFEKIKKIDANNNITIVAQLFCDIFTPPFDKTKNIILLNFYGSIILHLCFLKLYDTIKDCDQLTKDKIYNEIIKIIKS